MRNVFYGNKNQKKKRSQTQQCHATIVSGRVVETHPVSGNFQTRILDQSWYIFLPHALAMDELINLNFTTAFTIYSVYPMLEIPLLHIPKFKKNYVSPSYILMSTAIPYNFDCFHLLLFEPKKILMFMHFILLLFFFVFAIVYYT